MNWTKIWVIGKAWLVVLTANGYFFGHVQGLNDGWSPESDLNRKLHNTSRGQTYAFTHQSPE